MRGMDKIFRRSWFVFAPIAVAAAGAIGSALEAQAQTGSLGAASIACTNPASGATWQVRIDYDQSTVDANPARISDATISWHDAKDSGNYTLDRKSGELTVTIASSTGGYFIHDRCKPEHSG